MQLRDGGMGLPWDGRRGYVHLMQDSQPSSPRETHQVPRHSCWRFQGFVTILTALLLLGIGRIPWPISLHLRGTADRAARWRQSVQSAFLQGQVPGELPPHWLTRSVESVPIFQQNSTQADKRRVWLVKVWCNEELPLQLPVHPKDDFGRLQLLTKVAQKTGAEVLIKNDRDSLPITAIRANASQIEAILNETHDLVEFVEEDAVMNITKGSGAIQEKDVSDLGKPVPSKGRASLQEGPPSWGLDRIDQRGAVGNGSDAASYRYHPKAGESVHVYVLDTGIRTSHKDFGGRAVRELEVTEEKGLHLCDDSEDKECAMDKNGHGTRIAGIVGGHRYGVAKSATIHAVKILDDQGHGSSFRLVAALHWLISNAEQPAVLLLASYVRGQLNAVTSALDAATRAGLTVVVAATDRGLSAHPNACDYTPGFVESVLTVGASTRQDTQALTSSWGTCVDLLAPGAELVTTGVGSDVSEASLQRSSTALSAAHVAGAAALLLSEKPHLHASEVKQTLIATSTVGRLSQLHGSPDRLLNSLGEELQVPSWATQGMWSLVDGGRDRECGGLDLDDGGGPPNFAIFRQVKSLQSCKDKCEHSEETTGCAGISYSHEEEVCQIHVDLVRSSKQMTGYICLRHEAPTTTRTQTTTLSRTSSTFTSTTRTSTSLTSLTTTRSTVTTSAAFAQSWQHSQDLNCYYGAGAQPAKNGKDYIGALPLEDCLKACANEPNSCEASLYQDVGGDVGNCWFRSDVVLPECVQVPGYSLWFSPSMATLLRKRK